jgi:hypothetical protein
MVVLGSLILEGTLLAWMFPRVNISERISLSLLVWLVAFWQVF